MLRSILFPKTLRQASQYATASPIGLLAFMVLDYVLKRFFGIEMSPEVAVALIFTALAAMLHYFSRLAYLTIAYKRKTVREDAQLQHNPNADNYTSLNYDALILSRSTVPSGLLPLLIFVAVIMLVLPLAGVSYDRYVWQPNNPGSDGWPGLSWIIGLEMALVYSAIAYAIYIMIVRSKKSVDSVKQFAADNQFIFEQKPAKEVTDLYANILNNTVNVPSGTQVYSRLVGEYRGKQFMFLVVSLGNPSSFFTGEHGRREGTVFGIVAVPQPSGVSPLKIVEVVDQIDDDNVFDTSVQAGYVLMEGSGGIPQSRAGIISLFKRIDTIYDAASGGGATGGSEL